MSQKAKLAIKILSPQQDQNWTLAEIVLLLKHHGFTLTGGKGSHQVFTHPTYPHAIVLAAHGRDIKSGYVKAVRSALAHL